MKLYFDNIIFSLQPTGGISVYWYQLITRLLRDHCNVQFIEHPSNNVFRKKLTIPQNQILAESNWPVQCLRYLPLRMQLPNFSILHTSYYRWTQQKNIPQIVTVYDLIYERFRRGPALWVHTWQKQKSLVHADRILCISENTKKDLLSHYPQIPEKKVQVIYIAASDEFHPLPNIPNPGPQLEPILQKKYVLYVGDRAYYKNFSMAVDAIAQRPDFMLVAAGGRPLTKAEKHQLDIQLPKRFAYLPGLSTQELCLLYHHSFALLYPSIYEGFGIPVLEAMQVGCPVIAVQGSSIPEICGDAGILIPNPTSHLFAEALDTLENPAFRQTKIQAGFSAAKRFSWERCYQETMSVYQSLR